MFTLVFFSLFRGHFANGFRDEEEDEKEDEDEQTVGTPSSDPNPPRPVGIPLWRGLTRSRRRTSFACLRRLIGR